MKENCCNCKYCFCKLGYWFCSIQNYKQIYQKHIKCKKFKPTFFGKLFNIELDPDEPINLTENCKKPERPL